MRTYRTKRERELRRVVALVEKLSRFKFNRHHGIVAYGGGYEQRPREHFLDYCERVATQFPAHFTIHELPMPRLRRPRGKR